MTVYWRGHYLPVAAERDCPSQLASELDPLLVCAQLHVAYLTSNGICQAIHSQ